MSESRRGVLLGTAAYLIWGLFPLYWPLLAPATPLEILAHRIVWSLVFVVGVLLLRRRWDWLSRLRHDRRRLGLLVLAATVISVNWGVYIWGVVSGHVVETSLGYFINPLVTVVLGVVLLRERLRPVQWSAVGLAAVAVVVLTVDYGRLPWIALVLAASFATYGLAKKQVAMPALESLAVETGLLAPAAAAFLVAVQVGGSGTFGHVPAGTTALLVGAGVVTAVPLLLFGAAAPRIPLSTIGLLQYVTPIMQFLLGVTVFHEAMPASRWIGFAMIWAALVGFSADSVRAARTRAPGAPDEADEVAVEAADAH